MCCRTEGLCLGDLAVFTGKVCSQECGIAWIFRRNLPIVFSIWKKSENQPLKELQWSKSRVPKSCFKHWPFYRFVIHCSCRSTDLSHHRGDCKGLLPLILSAVSCRADSDKTSPGKLWWQLPRWESTLESNKMTKIRCNFVLTPTFFLYFIILTIWSRTTNLNGRMPMPYGYSFSAEENMWVHGPFVCPPEVHVFDPD